MQIIDVTSLSGTSEKSIITVIGSRVSRICPTKTPKV